MLRSRPAVVLGLALAVGASCGRPSGDEVQSGSVVREARYIEPLPWDKLHFTRVIGVGYPELGMERDIAHAETRMIDGRPCVVANIVSLDVDDDYAFDIDESVYLTVTYAPQHTTAPTFNVIWDQNGGDGHGLLEIPVASRGESGGLINDDAASEEEFVYTREPDAGFREITVTLERARLAGLGAQRTDLAIGAYGGVVALCDIGIERGWATVEPASFGRVQLEVTNAESGLVVPARVGIYDATGRAPMPSERAIPVWRFTDEVRRHWLNRRTMWPSANRQAFYMDGNYDARLPVGTYEIAVTRGPEYHSYHESFEVREDATTNLQVTLQRYDDLPARGWFSGDSHVHLQRDRVDDLAVWGQIAAEDVHVANLLEMGNIRGTYFTQPAWGKAGRFERDGYVLVSGQEDPRTGHRGHTIHWNLGRHTRGQADDFYEYHRVFERSRDADGITGYAHLGSLFDGQRGLALDVPFGLIDFIEVLQGGRLNTKIWYNMLNLGYRILPVAGADYPYFGPTLPGVERTYVKVEGEFSADAWFESFAQGRVYVTNGPFLDVTINGQEMGSELRLERGTQLSIVAQARMNPEIEELTRLEIVVLGDVVDRVPAQDNVAYYTGELTADRSMWMAVRAYGVNAERWYTTVAHSAPIYVIVDDEPTWKAEAVPRLVQEQLRQLEDLLTEPIDPVQDLESFETGELLTEEWTRQHESIARRVKEARARYERLLDELESSLPSS